MKTGECCNVDCHLIYSVIGSPSPQFVSQIFNELKEKGVVDGDVYLGGGASVWLTLDGWDRYELEKRGGFSGKFGFLALKFGDPDLDQPLDKHAKPSVKQAIGYDLVDMRDVVQAGVIDNIMRAQIRDSAFVVADLTHENAGAYWEAGYAEGLGKPVTYMCEKAKFEEASTHFDTNHCTTIVWTESDPKQFCRQLIATLRRSLNLFPTESAR